MREYGLIYCKIWTDPKFRSFKNDEKLLFIYLLTNEHCPLFGYYRLPMAYIADDLNWTLEHGASIMRALCSHCVIRYDFDQSWVLIPKFLKYNPFRNQSCADSMLKILGKYEENTPFYRDFLQILIDNPKHIKKEFLHHAGIMLASCPHKYKDNDNWKDKKKINNFLTEVICPQGQNLNNSSENEKNGADDKPIDLEDADDKKIKIKKSEVPNCPHKDIIALYHEILPMCPAVRVWGGNRKKALAARWKEKPKRQELKYWRAFFTGVKFSGFLTGKRPGSNGRLFFADLEFIVTESKFARIIHKKYHTDAEWAEYENFLQQLANETSQCENVTSQEGGSNPESS